MLMLLELFSDFAKGKGLVADGFLVGGTVRDILLGREIKDVDIVVNGDVMGIGRSFATVAGGSFVLLDKDFGIVRVVKNREYIDISALRGDAITNDLADRDLTINAMAIPLSHIIDQKSIINNDALKEFIIDPFNGQHDLKYRIIRMVSATNIVRDPLRLLRVYRFAATLNFSVEVHTIAAVKTHASLISEAAAERIAEELRYIFGVDDSCSTIKEIDKSGLLAHLFPEITLFSHERWHDILQSYGYLEHILKNLSLYFPDRSAPIVDYFAEDYRIFCLKIATLFQEEESVEKVARRFRLSRREIEYARMISSNGDVIKSLSSNRKPIIIGLLREFGDDIYALLISVLAGTRLCQLSENPLKSLAGEIVAIYQDEFIPRKKKLPFIDGNDLIGQFKLSPSPFFKDILAAVELLALEGQVNSREEALRAAGKMIKEDFRS